MSLLRLSPFLCAFFQIAQRSAASFKLGSYYLTITDVPYSFSHHEGRFHIHYRHYNGGGASLKKRLEKQICGKHGWENFAECGTGKADLGWTGRQAS